MHVYMSLMLYSYIQNFRYAQKLEDIRNTVLNDLSNSCQYLIIADNIDQEKLSCSAESSNHVTYLARFSGTSEEESAYLVSNIERWVSSGPTILVQGMLMRLGEDCNTTVSDLSAGVCSVFGAQTFTCECTCLSTTTIVAKVVAVAAVLIIAAIAVATLLILRSHRGIFSLQNTEEYEINVFLSFYINFELHHVICSMHIITP